MSGLVGLNYQSVEFLFSIYKIEDHRAMLEDLQQIERGVLGAIARANEKDKG